MNTKINTGTGWCDDVSSRGKRHYYVNGKSLCGKVDAKPHMKNFKKDDAGYKYAKDCVTCINKLKELNTNNKAMNTKIYLWVQPLTMNHEQCEKGFTLYFNCIIKGGGYTELDEDGLDELIEGGIMQDIMDFAGIDSNWNYKAISAEETNEEPVIEYADSPERKKANVKIAKIVTGENELKLTVKNVEIEDGGAISVSVPALMVDEKIDFPSIWDTIEKNFIGKINEGDTVTLADDDGNVIFEMTGGSFLNVGLADLQVTDSKTGALKGGVYIRSNGQLDIGDAARTFYLKIYTDKLLKASLKLNKSLMDITKQKLLK